MEFYDQVVTSVFQNVIVERSRNNEKIILWNFSPKDTYNRLYFNVACAFSDIDKEPIYLNMPLFEYLKFKWRRRHGRKNLRYAFPWLVKDIPTEKRSSVYMIMDYVVGTFGITRETVQKINNLYYGWVE